MCEAFQVRSFLEQALREDLGSQGDVTTAALFAGDRAQRRGKFAFVLREGAVLSGLFLLETLFSLVSPDSHITCLAKDGAFAKAGDVLAYVEGEIRNILVAERVALNLLSHMCGIATQTRQLVEEVNNPKVSVCPTRKTLPLLRYVQKRAVVDGGGARHRFGLGDAVLIKDNHIALADLSLSETLRHAKRFAGHMMKIELEVDTLAQLEEVIALDSQLWPDVVLLDNMSLAQLSHAVAMREGRHILLEASGGITLHNARKIGETGVDILSCGFLTNTMRAIDIGLDVA